MSIFLKQQCKNCGKKNVITEKVFLKGKILSRVICLKCKNGTESMESEELALKKYKNNKILYRG